MPRSPQTHCQRGHLLAGQRSQARGQCCRICQADRQRARRQSAGLVAPGQTARQAGAIRMWARRRDQYGPAGISEIARVRLSRDAQRRLQRHGHPNARKTHCKRGHALTPQNTYGTGRGVRQCKQCMARLKCGRPIFVEHQGARIYIRDAHDVGYQNERANLRAAMLAAHPDRSRRKSDKAFIQARGAWAEFVERERVWYAQFGLQPPSRHAEVVSR